MNLFKLIFRRSRVHFLRLVLLVSVCLCIHIFVVKPIKQSFQPAEVPVCPSQSSTFNIRESLEHIVDFVDSVFGLYNQIPFEQFAYPMDIDLKGLLKQHAHRQSISKYGVPVYKENIALMNKPKYKCANSGPLIVFLIKSAINNFSNRLAIRKTWANEKKFGYIRTVFIVGKTHVFVDQYKLEAEIKEHGDILQIDIVDHYHNNTKKLIACLNWTVHYCSTARTVMIVDDDYFVATDRVKSFIHNSEILKKESYVYMGYSISRLRPHRDPQSKWYISFEEYPYDKFPEFLAAGSLLLSNTFVKDALFAVPYVKQLYTDDVYLGIVAYKLGIKPIHNKLMSQQKVTIDDSLFESILTTHGYRCTHELHEAWNNTIQHHTLEEEYATESGTTS